MLISDIEKLYFDLIFVRKFNLVGVWNNNIYIFIYNCSSFKKKKKKKDYPCVTTCSH